MAATTKSRRDYGTGSIYQRTSDWMLVGTIEAGWNSNGTRRRKPVYLKGCVNGCPPRCQHRTAIKRKLAKKQQEADGGGNTLSARATVKTWSTEWLNLTETTSRPESYIADRSAVNKWIVPTIGHRRLSDLTPGDIRSVAQAQKAAGRALSSAVRTHGVLSRMLKAAILEGHPVPDRVLMVKPPTIGESDRLPMTDPEAVAVLREIALRADGDRWLVQILYGTRQAEALGLTWPEIDFDNAEFRIAWQSKRLQYRDKKDRSKGFRVPDGYKHKQLVGAWHLVEVKTKAGNRPLPMLPFVAAALEARHKQAGDNPYGLVWPDENGQPRDAKADRAEWYAIQEAAGVKHPSGRYYYTHEARNGIATALMEMGVDESIITAILGHASILSSKTYTHVRQEKMREAMEKIAARFQLGSTT